MNTSTPEIDLLMPGWARGPSSGKPDGGVLACFTTRNPEWEEGGATGGLNLGLNTADPPDRVRRNRQKLFERLGIDPEWTALARQVHGTRVRTVTEGGIWPDTDGLVTSVPGLALGIQVADCAALLMWDPSNRVVAAVHAGWRGAAGGIVPGALETMRRAGAEPSNLHVFVSPCISQAHFEVGEEVAEQFPGPFIEREAYAKPHVDLKGFLRHELTEAGVPASRIEVHPGCTYADETFYSYRRQGDDSGRMLGIISLPA